MTFHALLLMGALVLQGAPAQPPPSTEQLGEAYFLYLQGRALDDGDDLAGAAAKYRQALTLVPTAAELRAELANIYAQQGEFEQATAEAERALALAADNRSAHRVLGLLQASAAQSASPDVVRRGLLTSAAGHLERVLADGARDPLVQLTLGDLFVQSAQYPKAIEALKQFLLDRPGYPQAVMLLVQAYRGAGRDPEASALLEEFRGAADDSPAAQLRQVEQAERRGAWRDAADRWVQILSQDPDNVAYQLRFATALVNADDVDGGRRVLLDVTKAHPDDISAWYLLSQVELSADRLDEAERAARRVASIDAADPRGPMALADVRDAHGDFRGVVAVLEPRLKAATDVDVASGAYAEMASALGSAWVKLGEPKRAVQALEAAHRHAPADRRVLFSLASMYDRARQFDQAERALRDIIVQDAGYAPALNYLGYLLAERGRKLDEAVTLIKRALVIDADNPSYLDSLGWAYYKQGKWADATEPLERAAAAAPDASVIQDHLGDLYLKLKRFIEATAAYERALAGDRDGLDVEAVTKKRDRAKRSTGKP